MWNKVRFGWNRGVSRITSRQVLLASFAFVVCTVLGLSVSTLILRSQTLKYPKPPDAKNGERIYKTGCNACHGELGKGAPQTSTEFKRPSTFPDFTQCSATTAEAKRGMEGSDRPWRPVAGFLDHHARIWRTALLAGYRRRDCIHARILPESTLASWRAEPATGAGHREGLSGG